MDSHADSPVLGRGATVVRKTGRTVSVRGFSDELGQPISVPVVDGVITYECEYTGKVILLVVRNALHLPSMDNHLIPPFMMRLAGLEVNECAKFMNKRPNISHHSIYFPVEKLRIPLSLIGITSYIPIRATIGNELDELDFLELTPQSNSWDPHSELYRDQEDAMMDYKGDLKVEKAGNHLISAFKDQKEMNTHIVSSVLHRSLDLQLLSDDLSHRRNCSNAKSELCEESVLNISKVETIKVVKNNGSKSDLTPSRLAEVFNISNGLAVKTMNCVTRMCPRNTADISLNRRYTTNDRMLRYSRMLQDLFMDTMFAAKPRHSANNNKEIPGTNGKSVRGFTCVQVFATEFGWTFPVLMVSKKEAHLAVKKVFKKYGVPPTLICDAAREQIWGDTRTLCQHAGADLVCLEKGSHNANRAERAIETLKRNTV